jgi:HAD superfamily hydrolase (TIGR01509 family)
MTPYEAVLFDMDGVVIDTRQSVTAFWLALAAEHRVTLTPDDFDDHIYGVPLAHTLRALFPGLPPTAHAAVRERARAYERGLRYAEVRGVTALLRSLRAARVPTALVTSGEPWKVRAMTRQLGLAGLFDAAVTAADISRGKPDRECYVAAARRLNAQASRSIVFEDSISGVQAAVAAGSLCVGVQTGQLARRLRDGGAWRVVPDFALLRVTDVRWDQPAGVYPALRLNDGDQLILQSRRA